MAKLSETDKKCLLSSPFVEKITNSQVSFTPEFKIKAVKENLEGKSPIRIFNDAGLDTSLFLEDFPKKSIYRWKTIYLKEGLNGLKAEKRGKGAKGRPKKAYDPSDPRSVLDRLAYLEVENDFLKKLHALAAKSQKKKGTRS